MNKYTLRIKPAFAFSVASKILFPSTSPYVITTTANAIDILTFVTFGTSSLMGVSVNNLV
jgi:hypothetical protein